MNARIFRQGHLSIELQFKHVFFFISKKELIRLIENELRIAEEQVNLYG